MKVKWQSDTPNMELVIPKGQYLPYELPVATKEVLGGVKVDGDTINITSDGVISTQKVDLSGVATKVELEEVENKIPDTTGLATKSELATVESKIPDTSGLATKTELGEVMTSIPDVSGFATKTELNTVENKIPSIEGLATKNELDLVENKIPDVSNFVIRKEMTDAITEVEGKIPDTSGLATKTELTEVENKIPDVSSFATKDEIPNVSGFATKVELNAVQSSIPDTSGLATKVELSNVEANIPDISGLATKVELSAVENKIPDVSGFATKDEIPNVSGLATKVELNEVAATIPNSDDLATKAELNAVQSSIPDTTGLATKSEVSSVEAKIPDTSGLATKVELQTVESSIPSEYLKNASVADNKLTITKSSGDTIEFSGGSSGGGGGEKIIEFSTSPVGGATQADSAAAQKVKDKLQFIIDIGKDNILKDYKIIIDGVFITAVNIEPGNYATINFYTCGRQSNRFINFRCKWYQAKDYSTSETKKYIFDVGTSSIISGEEISNMIPKWEVAEEGSTDWHLFNAKELALVITDGNVYGSLYYNFSYDKDNVWTPTTLGQGYTNVNFSFELNGLYGILVYDGTEIHIPGGMSFVRIYYKT